MTLAFGDSEYTACVSADSLILFSKLTCYFCWTYVIPRATLLLRDEKRQSKDTKKQSEWFILKEKTHGICVTNTLIALLPFLCGEMGTQNLCWKNLFWVWVQGVYRTTRLSKCTKNAHLEELSKLTWRLDVFEIGPYSFPFSACKPRQTALNLRTQPTSSPGTPVRKTCCGARPGCRHP